MTQFIARWKSGRQARWRSLSWAEFRKYEQQLLYRCPMEVYLDVYRACVLEGPPEHDLTAGIVRFVGRSMLQANPFGGKYDDIKRAVDIKRQELKGTYLLAAKAVIASLFHYSFEEIDKWDPETFFERLAMAEFVSGRKIEPADPEAKDKKKAKQARRKDLTDAQKTVIDRVNKRDSRMPMPAEETISDPTVDNPPPPRRRELNDAQRLVVERVNKQRRQQ